MNENRERRKCVNENGGEVRKDRVWAEEKKSGGGRGGEAVEERGGVKGASESE